MNIYEEEVEVVATNIANLKLSGIDNYYLAKDIGDVSYKYKVTLEQAREDIMTRVNILVDIVKDTI